MWDTVVGFYGVCASVVTSALFAQAESAPLTGLENVSALGILGFTMYYLLSRVLGRQDKQTETTLATQDAVKELRHETKELKEEVAALRDMLKSVVSQKMESGE